MILFILFNVLGLSIVPLAILTKKKKIHRGIGCLSVLICGMFISLNLASGLYHIAGNEHAYQSALKDKALFLQREADLLAIQEATRPQKEVQSLKNEVKAFNYELELDRKLRSSIWVGTYTFAYATEHFSELYITLTL